MAKIMSRKHKADPKFCINRNSDFSKEIFEFFDKGETPSFEELWKRAEFLKRTDEEKPNYDIIQFSFLILNNQGNPLFIRRGPAHVITKGNSILLSCSPWMHPSGKAYPRSLDDIRFYFEQQVKKISSEYKIDFLGMARNVRKTIGYYFYIFCIQLYDDKPVLNFKEDDARLGYFNPTSPNSSEVLEGLNGNKVDLRVLEALFPLFQVDQSEVEGCILYKDYNHKLCDALFTTKELEITFKHIEDTQKDRIRFCLVQLNYSVKYVSPPEKFAYVLKEKDKVRGKVFDALEIAKQNEVNIIVFPELSFAEKWIKDIKNQYKEMIIIGGSYYKNGFNTCPVIINATVLPIQKANPSPNFEGEIGKRGMKQGKENFVFQTKYGRFIVLICLDYRNEISRILDSEDEKIKNVDFIIVPEYNKDIEVFQTQAYGDCKKEPYPYILQVNVWKAWKVCKIMGEEIGGTCVIGTEDKDCRQRYEGDGYRPSKDKINYKLIEAKEEMMVIVDLDIKRKGAIKPASGAKMNPIACYVCKADKWAKDKINIWL